MMNESTGARRATTGEQALAERLIAVMRLLRAGSSRTELAGLSNARYELLHALVHHGSMRMGEIAQQLGVSPRTITPMVDGLEADGLVVREADAADRRALQVSLTDQGMRVMHRAHDERIAQAASVFTALSAADRATLARLLDTILAADPDAR